MYSKTLDPVELVTDSRESPSCQLPVGTGNRTWVTDKSSAMTQQPQEDFDRSVEDAQAWMKVIQEQLQVNDNTKGPRAALEARLRETEKICRLEPEGCVKVELVLRAAEALLASCQEGQKPEILARLRDIKSQWEETVTYMTHCHSRIEWVWLHWSEYLLAQDEFYRWFQKMVVTLEPPVELQLGLKEKQWQLSHAQVLLHNVDNQAVLLDRLLEEAGSLFSRIGDPSVDEDAQKRMKAEYDAVKARAQHRVDLLAQVAQDHEQYREDVNEFQLWLKAVVEKVHSCLGRSCKLATELRLSALQDIAKDFPRGEESLSRLEEQAVGVIRNTSPLGAEKISGELGEMWDVLEKLRVLWKEEEGRLRGLLQSKGACEQQVQQLEAELGEFKKVLQRLAQEGLEPTVKTATEDELVDHWRLFSGTRAALASEEPRVDRLQTQLKKLVTLPDLQSLSDSVVAAIQEYQSPVLPWHSMKGKNARFHNATRAELWQRFQRPLNDLQLWKALAQRLLDITASLPDLASVHTFLPQIEAALAESSRLKEQLAMLQMKTELLGSIFGQERAATLLEQVTSSVRDRDLLHNSLLQRKSKLQPVLAAYCLLSGQDDDNGCSLPVWALGQPPADLCPADALGEVLPCARFYSLLVQHKDFGVAFDPLHRKLLDLQARTQAEKGLQRDLPGKQVQLLRLQGLQEEGLDLGTQIEAVRPLAHGNSKYQHKVDQISSDQQALQRSLEDLVDRSQQSVREHCTFSHRLLELQLWIATATQTLESHQGAVRPWDAESQEAGLESLLSEIPEKEVQLSLLQALGQLVMRQSSPEGAAVVQEELRKLMESWQALRLLEESVLSLVRNQQLPRTEVDTGKKQVFTNNIPKAGFLIDPQDPIPRRRRGANALEEHDLPEDHAQLLRDFERWLQAEDSKLHRIITMGTATAKDLRTREMKLQELEARIPEGQILFENLLRLRPAREPSNELEDLRYRWMLYKSKLKDSGHLLKCHQCPTQSHSREKPPPPRESRRQKRWRSPCSLLQKACRVALPLQLLLLLFLLLLFLLPAGEEERSCALANNFARSFAFMLRYNGPPPT
ncbi:Nesprin-3 [Apodemus speciosus]|uniref:Nesprin-3 n=1 Tax=Apodemus speciosus TaxID=105296 RepID=A0ABQ0FEY4_APOSI